MQTISLKSNSSEMVIPLLKNALDREKRILKETVKVTKDKVNKLAKELNVDIHKLMRGNVKHTESNDMQLIELEGEIELLRHLETELKELESVKICA
jgi:MoaA/NifB/PqqE/SkfB family radical SAM enzyme